MGKKNFLSSPYFFLFVDNYALEYGKGLVILRGDYGKS